MIYLDNIIVYDRDEKTRLDNLDMVFYRLFENGFRANKDRL